MDEVADIIATALRATTPAGAHGAKAKYILDPTVAAEPAATAAPSCSARHPLYPGIEL